MAGGFLLVGGGILVVMLGEADRQGELLDVRSVVGHLLVEGSMFAFLAQHRQRLFPVEMFAQLFPSPKGRPSIPADQMASVIVLQSLLGLSDREAADAVSFDLRWKAACGFGLGSKAFHPTTLTYWRRRLAGSKQPHLIFDRVREVITETGVLAGKHRRALDSTVLDDAVARQDTVTQLIAAIRRVARVVDDGEQVVTAQATRLARLTGAGYDHSGKPRIAWDDEAAQQELVSALVNDALAVLGVLDVEAIGKKDDPTQQQAVALLALVAGQDVEPAEGSDGTDGRWQIARKTAPDRVISTVDIESRHAHKTQSRQQDGYKAHVVVEPDTGLVTRTELTQTTGSSNSDAAVGARLVTTDPTVAQEDTALEVLGDSAYGTGKMLATLAEKSWTAVVKPWPHRSKIENGFLIDDFHFDVQANTLTCPNMVTRPVSAKGRVSFGVACRGCPMRARCTTSATGRMVLLGEHHQLQREHRKRFTDNTIQDTYRHHRPMVERSIAWLTRGNRRLRYRGRAANNHWLHHRAAAINLNRLTTMGLAPTNTGWALA